MPHVRTLIALCLLALAAATSASAQGAPEGAGEEAAALRVATYECPPFAYRDEAGGWGGLGIELWEEVADRLDLSFAFEELQLADMLSAAEAGRIDIGVSCVSITTEREERVDFSHAIYQTHLAIAVRENSVWRAIANVLTDRETLYILGIVVAVASVVGGIYYLLEHRINPKLYSRKTLAGKLVEGFVLGLLFITRGPFNYYEFQTLTGRVMTVLLAVATTIFVASFTAVLASAFTVDRLRSDVTGPADLPGLAVGVKADATSGRYLDGLGIGYAAFDTVREMLDALEAGTLDAVVADDPVLRYEIKLGQEAGRYEPLTVLPYQFERQSYGLVMREDPEFLEEMDRTLLAVREGDVWAERVGRYLGVAN
jgi:polar amino acid transport system substrate-binding protein